MLWYNLHRRNNMAKEHNPKSKLIKKVYATIRMTNFASGIRACYKYDSRVRSILDDMEENFEMCLGILPSHKTIVITKKASEVNFRLVDNFSATTGVSLYFKNIEFALLVLTNRLSYASAYAQGRFTLVGETRKAVNFIHMLNIVQNYFASDYSKKVYLKIDIRNEVAASKVKGFIYFRGWL